MAKPVGKVQRAVLRYLCRFHGDYMDVPDMTADPTFHGVHFARIESAVRALVKKRLIVRRNGSVKAVSCPRR